MKKYKFIIGGMSVEVFVWSVIGLVFLGGNSIFAMFASNLLPVISCAVVALGVMFMIAVGAFASEQTPCSRTASNRGTFYIISNLCKSFVFFAYGWYWHGLSFLFFSFSLWVLWSYIRKNSNKEN